MATVTLRYHPQLVADWPTYGTIDDLMTNDELPDRVPPCDSPPVLPPAWLNVPAGVVMRRVPGGKLVPTLRKKLRLTRTTGWLTPVSLRPGHGSMVQAICWIGVAAAVGYALYAINVPERGSTAKVLTHVQTADAIDAVKREFGQTQWLARCRYGPEVRETILSLQRQGLGPTSIARETGLTRKQVYLALRREASGGR